MASHPQPLDRHGVLRLATAYHNQPVVIVADSEYSICERPLPYYESYLLASGDGDESKTTCVANCSEWLHGPGTSGRDFSWSYNWTWTTGGGHADSSALLAWLRCDPSFGYAVTTHYDVYIPEGLDGDIRWTDQYHTTWATYEDWYFYPDPDRPDGPWHCMYVGQYTARSKKFYERVFSAHTRTCTGPPE